MYENIYNKDFVEKFIIKFGGRYLKIESFKKLSENEKRFHLFGHWNKLVVKDKKLIHFYMCGGTGELKNIINEILLEEIKDVIFIRHHEGIILFKKDKGSLKTEYISNELLSLEILNEKHKFLYDNGIRLIRNSFSLNENGVINLFKIDAVTGKKIKIEEKKEYIQYGCGKCKN